MKPASERPVEGGSSSVDAPKAEPLKEIQEAFDKWKAQDECTAEERRFADAQENAQQDELSSIGFYGGWTARDPEVGRLRKALEESNRLFASLSESVEGYYAPAMCETMGGRIDANKVALAEHVVMHNASEKPATGVPTAEPGASQEENTAGRGGSE